MKITQISVFAENKPGQIAAPFRLLADAGVNIRALSIAESQKFGIVRMIVSDPRSASKLLTDGGFMVKTTEVLALEVPDRPGGLAELLSALQNTSLNIEYMYAFPFTRGDSAVLITRFDNPDAAIERLQAAGISVVAREQL